MTDLSGNPVEIKLGPGNEHDINKGFEFVEELTSRTKKFIADMGYDSDLLRKILRKKLVEPVIPGRKSRKKEIKYDKDIYRERHAVENRHCVFKQFRCISSRFDKLSVNFLSTIYLAAIVAWAKL
jgi:transposase